MSPLLASTLCFFFIAAVLYRDREEENQNTLSLLVPLAWFLIIGSKPVYQWLYPDLEFKEVSELTEGNPLDRTIFIFLMLCGLFILARRKIDWGGTLGQNAPFFILALYCGVSVLWSDFGDIAFRRWVRGIGSLIMVLVVLTESDPALAVRTLLKRWAFLLVPLSVLLIKYYPQVGVSYGYFDGSQTFVGVTNDKNALGRLCMIAGMFFSWDIIAGLKLDFRGWFRLAPSAAYLVLIAWLLYKANSVTSLLGLCIGVCAMLVLCVPLVRRNLTYATTAALVCAALLLAFAWAFDLMAGMFAVLGRNMTFTGRIDIWRDCLRLAEHPFIGTGYYSFWLGSRLDFFWDKYWFQPTEAHNGYLETYIGLGIVGLVLLFWVLLSSYAKILDYLRREYVFGMLRAAFFCMILLYNVSESTFHLSSTLWFVFMLSTIALVARRRHGQEYAYAVIPGQEGV